LHKSGVLNSLTSSKISDSLVLHRFVGEKAVNFLKIIHATVQGLLGLRGFFNIFKFNKGLPILGVFVVDKHTNDFAELPAFL